MGKKFNNINEELERIQTLMFETDNFIKNGTPLHENIEEQTLPAGGGKLKIDPKAGKAKFKTSEGKFKIAKIDDNQFSIKGKGAGQFLDDKGEITSRGYNFIQQMLPQIGGSLDSNKLIVRLGDKEKNTPDLDKIFFTVVDKKDIYTVKNDKTLQKLSDAELSQKQEIKKTEVEVPKTDVKSSSTTTTGTGQSTTTSTTDTTKTTQDGTKTEEKSSIIGKTFKDLGTDTSKLIDATEKMHSQGYTRGFKYFIDPTDKTVYSLDKNDKIDYVFNRNVVKSESVIMKENLNMDLIFVNPLLFESVISEQEKVGDYYMKDGVKLSQKFTDTVDSILSNKEQVKDVSDAWGKYPCVAKNSAMKQTKMTNGSIAYKDAANYYYSNGRFMDIKTKKMGNYHCEGDKIVSDKKVTPEKPKTQVVTDADLVGETGILQNILHSPVFMGSVIPVLAALEFGTAGAATPLVAAAAGGAGALSSAIDRTNRRHGVKGVVDALDGWVDEDDLLYTFMVIKSLDNKFYYDDTLEVPEYISATQAFMDLYQEDEGSDLISDIDGVGTKTLQTGSEKLKKRIIATINRQIAQVPPADLTKSSGTEGTV